MKNLCWELSLKQSVRGVKFFAGLLEIKFLIDIIQNIIFGKLLDGKHTMKCRYGKYMCKMVHNMYQVYVLYASIACVSDGKDAVDGTMPPNTIPRHQGYGSRDILYTLCIYIHGIFMYTSLFLI